MSENATYAGSKIRTIQQNLNRDYNSVIGLIPCNGIYTRSINKALIYALQVEENASPIDGLWGDNTMSLCPTLSVGSTKTKFIALLEYALYCNGNDFDPLRYDGVYDANVTNAVAKFQAFVCLGADEIVGKQTWTSLLISYGDKNRTATACDCSTVLTAEKTATLIDNGYTAVGRYITGKYKMTGTELEDINQSNLLNQLKIFPIYENGGYELSYFSTNLPSITGEEDAYLAILAAKQLNFPEGTIIYFAVDCDVVDFQVTKYIIPYFGAIDMIINTFFHKSNSLFAKKLQQAYLYLL